MTIPNISVKFFENFYQVEFSFALIYILPFIIILSFIQYFFEKFIKRDFHPLWHGTCINWNG